VRSHRLERAIFPRDDRQALCILTLALPLIVLQQRNRNLLTVYWDSSKTFTHSCGIRLCISGLTAPNTDDIGLYLENRSAETIVATYEGVVMQWNAANDTLLALKKNCRNADRIESRCAGGWLDMVEADGWLPPASGDGGSWLSALPGAGSHICDFFDLPNPSPPSSAYILFAIRVLSAIHPICDANIARKAGEEHNCVDMSHPQRQLIASQADLQRQFATQQAVVNALQHELRLLRHSRLAREIFSNDPRQSLGTLTLAMPLVALQQPHRTGFMKISKTVSFNGVRLVIRIYLDAFSESVSLFLDNPQRADVNVEGAALQWSAESDTLDVLPKKSREVTAPLLTVAKKEWHGPFLSALPGAESKFHDFFDLAESCLESDSRCLLFAIRVFSVARAANRTVRV
jgi:hypothetical protein